MLELLPNWKQTNITNRLLLYFDWYGLHFEIMKYETFESTAVMGVVREGTASAPHWNLQFDIFLLNC